MSLEPPTFTAEASQSADESTLALTGGIDLYNSGDVSRLVDALLSGCRAQWSSESIFAASLHGHDGDRRGCSAPALSPSRLAARFVVAPRRGR